MLQVVRVHTEGEGKKKKKICIYAFFLLFQLRIFSLSTPSVVEFLLCLCWPPTAKCCQNSSEEHPLSPLYWGSPYMYGSTSDSSLLLCKSVYNGSLYLWKSTIEVSFFVSVLRNKHIKWGGRTWWFVMEAGKLNSRLEVVSSYWAKG